MFGDVRFTDLIRIHQIRSKPKKNNLHSLNKNYQEFADVYKEVLAESLPDSSRFKPRQGGILKNKYLEIFPNRPLHNVKKIHLEMPVLGAESAIVTAPKVPERKPARKKVKKQDKSLVTEAQITKWGSKEPVKPKVIAKDSGLLKDTHLLLKQTKQEIDESSAQLEAIKTLIHQIKPPEKIRKSRVPTYKARRKPDRHAECISKRYMTTLNTMQQKLKKLEEKYFSKPNVVYKNVRDICTTFSNMDLLYQRSSSTGNVNVDDTLEGIKQELDTIVNTSLEKEKKQPKKSVSFKAPEVEFSTVGDTYDEERSIDPVNFSFKKAAYFEDDLTSEEQRSYSKIIDQSESWFKKYLNVNNLCQEISNVEDDKVGNAQEEAPVEAQTAEESDRTTDESDKESHDSAVDKFYLGNNLAFLNRELQGAIASSSFLSKEFDKTMPSVKVFPNTGNNYLRGKCFGVRSKRSGSIEPSITDLIENLSLSLKGSIYYKGV